MHSERCKPCNCARRLSTCSNPGFQINEEDASDLQRSLTALLASEKLYRNPQLTLKDVASRLDASPRAVSHIVNHLEQKTMGSFSISEDAIWKAID